MTDDYIKFSTYSQDEKDRCLWICTREDIDCLYFRDMQGLISPGIGYEVILIEGCENTCYFNDQIARYAIDRFCEKYKPILCHSCDFYNVIPATHDVKEAICMAGESMKQATYLCRSYELLDMQARKTHTV